ncbi:MAG: AAA family ATPase [Patescibacteria group bacterium]
MREHEEGAQETSPTKENIFNFNFKALTVNGHAGSGESTVGRMLSENLGIDFYDIGMEFRSEQDREIIDFQERPLEKDIEMDERQKIRIRNATADKPVVLVAKLAGVNVSELPEEESQNVLTIFVTCPSEERFRRILERERERGVKDLNLKRVAQETRNREKSDINQWAETHPQLAYINPFDPDAKDENGKRIYKYKVSSYNRPSVEIAYAIIRRLTEDGWITKVEDKENPTLSTQGQIYSHP